MKALVKGVTLSFVLLTLLSVMTVLPAGACTNPGTRTPGYWKNHPEAWPVDTITIGGVDYTKDEAIAFMWLPKSAGMEYSMFSALVSTKLNILIGNYATWTTSGSPYAKTTQADAWLAEYFGTGVKANSDAWKQGEPIKNYLDDYNNGLLEAPPAD